MLGKDLSPVDLCGLIPASVTDLTTRHLSRKVLYLILPLRFWSAIVCNHMETRLDVIIVLLYIINFPYRPTEFLTFFVTSFQSAMDIILSLDRGSYVSRN